MNFNQKLSRRSFLAILAKFSLAALVLSLVPIKFTLNSAKSNKFIMKVRSLYRRQLYNHNELAG